MLLLLIFFLLSICFSFLCSVWEAVLLSITPSYISRKEQEGSPLAAELNAFKEDIDRPLSAILTLNTIAHTVGAIGVGAQAAKLFGDNSGLEIAGLHIGAESIVATVMTLAILILSEIIPKTIGANYWQSLAPFTVKSLNFIILVLSPFVWISQGITKRLKKEKGKSVLSRADLFALTATSEKTGVLGRNESTTIKNLLRLDQLKVSDIMTPRAVMITASENRTVKDFYGENKSLPVSRIPLHAGQKENFTGILLKDELLQTIVEGQGDLQLKELKRPLIEVDQEQPLSGLLDILLHHKTHLALVVDSYKSVVGLVTQEDLF